jgi:hypothetical protein
MSIMCQYEEKCLESIRNTFIMCLDFLKEIETSESIVTIDPSGNSTSMIHVQLSPDDDYIFVAF